MAAIRSETRDKKVIVAELNVKVVINQIITSEVDSSSEDSSNDNVIIWRARDVGEI